MLAMSSFEVQRQDQGSTAYPFGNSDVNRDLASSDCIVSSSLAMRDALERIERVAPTGATVLITGETGTGKELVARAVHRHSRRANRPLVAVNVGAIPESLVSSELFGHEQGAFTGAVQRRIGRFEQADRATLFLDEVSELSSEMQVALLRVLQEREFERLGSSQVRRVDIRIIAATNRLLERDVAQKQFRADLYYRLNVFPIHVPPLRERPDDIPALASHFLRHNQRRLGRQFAGIEPASLKRMQVFSWPGNVRQLENIIEQSMILCDDPLLEVPAAILDERQLTPGVTSKLGAVLKENEQQMIEEALTTARGRVSGPSGAAERLGLPPSTVESKIRRYNIDKLRYRRSLA
jgi:formate hydrogenlyase transcriptional activator